MIKLINEIINKLSTVEAVFYTFYTAVRPVMYTVYVYSYVYKYIFHDPLLAVFYFLYLCFVTLK